jgi:hypothetical protein
VVAASVRGWPVVARGGGASLGDYFWLNQVSVDSVNESQTWSNWVKAGNRQWRNARDAKASQGTCPDLETDVECVQSVREREPYTKRYNRTLVYLVVNIVIKNRATRAY